MNNFRIWSRREFLVGAAAAPLLAAEATGLVGYWPLSGDVKDHSGRGNHGINHRVDLSSGHFDGCGAYIEVPDSPSLDFKDGEFSASLWVHTKKDVDDVIGDVLSKYDATVRRGFNLSIQSSAGGYNSQGSDKHVVFGIDNARTTEWETCGRPSPTSNYVSNSLTVFDGHLYAGTTDGATFEDWSRVYRYLGAQRWEDCGRVGNLRTRGVGPMIVHNSSLYVANWSYDWTRVSKENDQYDDCRVWRYKGGQEWEDCGQPGNCKRLFGIASYRGKLYILGDDHKCHVWNGDKSWKVVGEFGRYVHPMIVHDGKLYIAGFSKIQVGPYLQAAVFSWDGAEWANLGSPLYDKELADQIHAFQVYRGKLHTTTWPGGRVCVLDGDRWVDCGRLGDSTEMNGLAVYNGKLYCGTIPRAEVFRFEGGARWTRLARFYKPEGWEPVPVGYRAPRGVKVTNTSANWTRVTSLTVYGGRLFASIGSCTSALADAPADVRGEVHSMRAGECTSYDKDIRAGWNHITAIRKKGTLELYINGQFQAKSDAFNGKDYSLAHSQPLKIGFGEMDYFSGRIKEVRIYNRALNPGEIAKLARKDWDG